MAGRVMGVAIFAIIYIIYATIRLLNLEVKKRKYDSVNGTIANVSDSQKKDSNDVTVSFELPSGRSYTQEYTIKKMKSPSINSTTIVYYRTDDPYQSFIQEEETATKRELAIMFPLTLVLCVVLALVLLPSMPKDVSDRFSKEVTVQVDVCYENEIADEKNRVLNGRSLYSIGAKTSGKPYKSLEHEEKNMVLADGREVTVDHYWGEKRILVVNKGYSNDYFKLTYYFVTMPVENSNLVAMAIFEQNGYHEIDDINERIEEFFKKDPLREYLNLPEEAAS